MSKKYKETKVSDVTANVGAQLQAERQQLQVLNEDEHRLTVSVIERDLRIAQIDDDLALLGFDPHRPVATKKPQSPEPVPWMLLSAYAIQGIGSIIVLVLVLTRIFSEPALIPTSPIDPYAYLTRPERIQLPAPVADDDSLIDEDFYLITEPTDPQPRHPVDQYECVPTAEVCDNMDNDCDGLIDEVFSLISDHENCGMCGLSCSQDQVCQNAHCVWNR